MMLIRSITYRNHVLRHRNVLQKRNFSIAGWVDRVDHSAPVAFATSHLCELHNYLNIPWWSEIALVTIGLRALVTLSLNINQRKIFQRFHSLAGEIQTISNNLRAQIKKDVLLLGGNRKNIQQIHNKMLLKEVNRLIIRDNCHPLKAAILPFFQIPIFFILSHSYKNLARLYPDPTNTTAQLAHQQLQQEGTLWFTDLTVPDPTGILPIITGVTNIINIQVYVNERKKRGIKDSFFIKLMTNGGRILSFSMIPFGLAFPADMTLYWAISATWSLCQNLALQNSKVKEALGLKDLASPEQQKQAKL